MSETIKKAIGGIYSWAADKIYEPVVVHFGFPLLGGDLNEAVLEQGRRAVQAAGGRPLLDMPVGTASFTVRAAQIHSGLVVGADFAEGMVREAMRAARRERVSGLVAVRADAHHLPFKDSSFGAILCTNGLQVIPGLEASLGELARVLAPGGTLFLSVITLPLSTVAPSELTQHLPTLLLSPSHVLDAVERAGLHVSWTSNQRLATLAEATKR